MSQIMYYKNDRNSIANLIEDGLWLRKGKLKGKEIFFLCPFPNHDDHHPSARWNSEKKVFFCDVCREGGGHKKLAKLLGILSGGAYV